MVFIRPIDLFRGWPAPELIPSDAFKEAAVQALSSKAIIDAGFGYGPDEGHMPLRENIAKWLTQFYAPQEVITSSRICVTGGASQNLASILQVFTDPVQTKMVWLIEPTYHLVFRTLEDAGFHGRMRGIPEDESGMDVQALESALTEFADADDGENSGESYVCCLLTLCELLVSGSLTVSDSQTGSVLQEDLQAHHLLCAQFFQSVRDNDDAYST